MSNRNDRFNVSKIDLPILLSSPHTTFYKCFNICQNLKSSPLSAFPQLSNWHLQPLRPGSWTPVTISGPSLSLIIHLQSLSKLTDSSLLFHNATFAYASDLTWDGSSLFQMLQARSPLVCFWKFDKPLLALGTLHRSSPVVEWLSYCHIINWPLLAI